MIFSSRSIVRKSVVVGTTNLKKGGDSFKIKRVIVHPEFNIRKLINDRSSKTLFLISQFFWSQVRRN